MSWKKHFSTVSSKTKLDYANRMSNSAGSNAYGSGSKYSSYLPEVYAGAPNRLERYSQFDEMDLDSEVNASLDTIADFCTQPEQDEDNSFMIHFKAKDNVTESEVEVLQATLNQWCELNEFNSRIWRIVRTVLKYGDIFFIRDPETMEWQWVDPYKVKQVIVNTAEGKKPEEYIISDLDLNLQTKVATKPETRPSTQGFPFQYGNQSGAPFTNMGLGGNPPGNSSVIMNQNDIPVDAKYVVHLSLSEGLDSNWPFGTSILESVFKVFRQKQLLEDSLLIYRVQRAPERRIFYIDVGDMPPNKAMTYVERMKNEIHQRRIPNRTGGGTSIMDASYNPLSILEDYFFAQTAGGRGSRVETLPGGENLGQIDDLKFFNNKLMRGLRVPSAYLPTGPDDGQQAYNDGKTGTAYIQEFRFTKYCQRIQNLLAKVIDEEFKIYIGRKGINVDRSIFEVRFQPPQNFAKYRQIEIDTALIGVFQPLAEMPYMSKRFLLSRYLGWSEDEIIENETMWKEENAEKVEEETKLNVMDQDKLGLGAVGFRPDLPGGDAGGGLEDIGDLGEIGPEATEGGPESGINTGTEGPGAAGQPPAGGETPGGTI